MQLSKYNLFNYFFSGVNSEKFMAAKKNKIPCVSMNWIYDSVKAGVALQENDYQIKVSTSTPTKTGHG